jgi:hypothetical protein
MNTYENNQVKPYAVIWERCTCGMKQKIESRVEFPQKIENNPIELLRAIKEYTQNFHEHCYNMSIVLDSLRSLMNLHQREVETLQDWTKQVKAARDIFESHLGGPMILTKIVEMSIDFDPSDLKKVKRCQEREFETFLAYLYLENADKSKY